ncbi:MAG TPA: thioredoxin domain-containing protein, partial [Bacteroidales bacterium]|nr:thioredoxin domain-containing protein [Bacteroidales bacterium]
MSQPLNRLSKETSPYLLQHATNPVDWYPWGDEAFEKARQENKLMLISVGYSSCHWCHVMEREAFSDVQVAEFMNTHYVCVKVDREERPDVDQIYMNAVQIITRSGGWPLNCFATPDGRPVYGGTYFPAEPWLDILKSL